MRLFMRAKAEKGLKDFEEGLDKYFTTARKYRSSLRRGSVVLIDESKDMYTFFNFLVEKCGLNVGIVHVTDEESAKKALLDLGSHKVKAVVIDSGLFDKVNGLKGWLEKEFRKVPVWVSNCDSEFKAKIRTNHLRLGVIDSELSLASLAEAIGFPSECRQFAEAYSE